MTPGVSPRHAVTLGVHIVDTLGRPVTEIAPGQSRQVLEQIRIAPAGTAGGTSVGLAKLGIPVVAVGAVGTDSAADFLISELRHQGVETAGLVRTAQVQTASSILPIRPNGERPALTVPGANGAFAFADIDFSLLEGAAVVHIGGPDVLLSFSAEELARVAARARDGGATVTMDVLTPGDPDALARLAAALVHVRYFMPNEEQLRRFTGERDLVDAARVILGLGVEAVIVSRGADGATVVSAGETIDLPAYPTDVVDTTGCGDAVSAGVIAGLMRGWPLAAATRLGLAAASLVAGGLGSDAGIVDFASTARIVTGGTAPPGELNADAGVMAGELPAYDDLPRGVGECPSAWTLFGDSDRVGLLHLQTPSRVAAAARLIRDGRVFSLNAALDAIDPPMYGRGAVRHTLHLDPGDIGFDDHLDNLYPQSSTQWDSLAHVAYKPGVFFGDVTVDDVRAGAAATIDVWARRGIAGRGVVLDLDSVLGGAGEGFDPRSTRAITVDELEEARERAGVRWRPGDIMLLYTGYLDWYRRQSPTVRAEVATADPHRSVGLAHGEDMIRYLWNAHVAAIAADNPALEAWPVQDGEFGSLHRCLIGRFGLAIGEFFDLGELTAACRRDGRSEVFFTAAPLHIPGGVGSTGNALALT